MSAATHESISSASLNLRIREVEQRLARRQTLIRAGAATLGRDIREKLSSPIALLVAVGAGFAIGQFSQCKRAEPDADTERSTTRPSIFATVMDAYILARPIMAMLSPILQREPASDTGNNEAMGATP